MGYSQIMSDLTETQKLDKIGRNSEILYLVLFGRATSGTVNLEKGPKPKVTSALNNTF